MKWDIAYNTSNDELIFSEYGRGVQDLLRRAGEVPDEERQAYVERIIQLMAQMEPGVKQQENYQERLWKHAFAIAGGELDVTVPEGVDVTPEAERAQPDPLPYPDLKLRKPHYGQNVINLIEEGKTMEDGPERDLLAYTAAYYMRVALADWRGGKFLNEDMIRNDLYELSDKVLALPKDAKIGVPHQNQPSQDDGTGRRRKKKKKNRGNNNSGGGGGNNNNNSGGGGSRRSRKNRNRRR